MGRRGSSHGFAGTNRTCDGNQLCPGMGHDALAGIGLAQHHVEGARRQEWLSQLGQHQRAFRRRVARLENHGVSGRQCRGDLPDGHHQGIVPGRDLPHHTQRLAPDGGGQAFHVFTAGTPFQQSSSPGKETQLIGRDHHFLLADQGLDLTRGATLGIDQAIGMLLDRIGQAQQRLLAHGRSGLVPFGEGCEGGIVGGIHIGLGGIGRTPVDLSVDRTDKIEDLGAGRFDVLAVDEMAEGRDSHAVSPDRWWHGPGQTAGADRDGYCRPRCSYRRSTRKRARIVVNPCLPKGAARDKRNGESPPREGMAEDRPDATGRREAPVSQREHARTTFSLDGTTTDETGKDGGDG